MSKIKWEEILIYNCENLINALKNASDFHTAQYKFTLKLFVDYLGQAEKEGKICFVPSEEELKKILCKNCGVLDCGVVDNKKNICIFCLCVVKDIFKLLKGE